MKKKLTTALLCAVFLATSLTTVRAQDATDEPTPTPETTEQAPVVVIVEAPAPVEPVEPAPTSTVQSFLFTGAVFAGLAVLTFVFWQQGKNLKVVAGTVPPEIAQLIFRLGMGQVSATEELYDDEALKTLAKALGYEVFQDENGAFTIRASAQAVAQNVENKKDAYLRSADR